MDRAQVIEYRTATREDLAQLAQMRWDLRTVPFYRRAGFTFETEFMELFVDGQ